jgi:hypothetical protein
MTKSQSVTLITEQEFLDLQRKQAYWDAQCVQAEQEIKLLEAELARKDALIKDLQSQLERQEVSEGHP